MTFDAAGMVMNTNSDRLPPGCPAVRRDYEFTVRAGTGYAAPFPGNVFGMSQHEFRVEPCSRVTFTFINEDAVRHQFMIHNLPRNLYPQGMFHLEAVGGATKRGTLIVPAGNKTYLVHCDIAQHMEQAAANLPEDAAGILQRQVEDLSQRQQALGIGAIAGILVALWSARKGMVALMTATNVAYDEEETRGFFKQLFVSLAFTVGAVLGFLAVLLLGVMVPIGLSLLPLGPATSAVLLIARWVILFGVAIVGLAIVYRFAPDRREAKWKWVTPGSLIAALLWLGGSLLFALYVRNWSSYGDTYGALGSVIVLLMWFYLSGYVVILGAEINSELERQTRRDTTEGPTKPMGRRGAYSADTLGPSASELDK